MENNNPEGALNPDEKRRKYDADSGNDGSTNEMLQHEKLIDPGNEHSHHFDDNTFEKDQVPKFDADAGGDATGTVGRKPEDVDKEEADTTGENG
jgi:hypothetical protein